MLQYKENYVLFIKFLVFSIWETKKAPEHQRLTKKNNETIFSIYFYFYSKMLQ